MSEVTESFLPIEQRLDQANTISQIVLLFNKLSTYDKTPELIGNFRRKVDQIITGYIAAIQLAGADTKSALIAKCRKDIGSLSGTNLVTSSDETAKVMSFNDQVDPR